jgi:hypothetical protein
MIQLTLNKEDTRIPAVRIYKRLTLIALIFATSCVAEIRPPFPGSIKLPPNFHIRTWFGIDSLCGEIIGDSGVVIRYDIGEMAGVATANGDFGESAKNLTNQHLRGEISRKVVGLPKQFAVVVVQKVDQKEQQEIFAKSKAFDPNLKLVRISFPNSHANFWIYVPSQKEIDLVEGIVLTYVPLEFNGRRDIVGSRLDPYLKQSIF